MNGMVTVSISLPVRLVTHLYVKATQEKKGVSSIVGETLEALFVGEKLEIVKTTPNPYIADESKVPG